MARRRKKRVLRPRMPARTRKRKRASKTRGRQHPELIGLALAALGIFLASVLYADWNGGYVGAWIADAIRTLVGSLAYVVPVGLAGVGALMVGRSAILDLRPFRMGIAVLSFGLIVVSGRAHGGAFGHGLESLFSLLLGHTGTKLLGSTAIAIGGLLLSGASIGAGLRRAPGAVKRVSGAARRRMEWPEPLGALPAPTPMPPPVAGPPVDAFRDFPDVVGSGALPENPGPPPLLVGRPEDEEHPSLFDVRVVGKEDYRLPDRALLRRSEPASAGSADAGARIAEQLAQTLAHFGVDATVIGQIAGPRVTRYELQLAPGTKVSKVAALKDDLSYALATTEIRILAPIPGKQAVGVELPNFSPNLVTLGDIFEDLPGTASPLAVWLGKDISGAPVWTDLARMPHLLIAGTTGSGKSGCINTMLTSILLRSTPDEVRFILIDPKKIELSYYESIPHLLTPVVSSPKEAAAVLTNVVGEMDRRYERLSSVRARSLPEANRALRQRGEEPMPYLLIVIDELADLMMVSPQEVEDCVIRLAQKSRAVGIHLALATQRPSVDVITGMIKANVPSRIAFAVSSQTDSRVILDQAGAESLLGQGDMLFKPLGTSRLQRLQGAYVSEEEIALVVEQCRHQREQELDESLLEVPEAAFEESGGDGDFDPNEDPLLERAIEIVVQTQTASVSLIQRRLRVGYTRAGRLIDMLERRGIISGYEGSKPRRVLVGEGDLDRMLEAAS
jgi:DNA segregation ATPase FtsK/SpoIIIE, S-DNA-T family